MVLFSGACDGIRTCDLLITNELHYHCATQAYIKLHNESALRMSCTPLRNIVALLIPSHCSLFLHLILLVLFVHRTALATSPNCATQAYIKLHNESALRMSCTSIFNKVMVIIRYSKNFFKYFSAKLIKVC